MAAKGEWEGVTSEVEGEGEGDSETEWQQRQQNILL